MTDFALDASMLRGKPGGPVEPPARHRRNQLLCTSHLPKVAEIMRDLRYPDAAAAREHFDWLAWLELGNKSERTLNSYSWATEHLLAAYPTVSYPEFVDSHLLRVLTRLGRTNDAGSMKAITAAYRSWFRWGVRTRRRPDNPCDLLPDFRGSRPRPVTVFTEAEELALRGLPFPDGQLATVLFEAGLRREEACNLRSRDADLDTRLLHVHGKGDKHRIIGITPDLGIAFDELRLLEGLTPDCYWWHTQPGGTCRRRHDRPKTFSALRDWWIQCCEQAGVDYRSLHKTRHTFGTRWRQRGLKLEDIQELMGHEDPGTTKRYTHAQAEDILARMDAILLTDAETKRRD